MTGNTLTSKDARMTHPKIRKRILIIASNAEAAEILGILLRSYNYDVIVEHSGKSGLAAAESQYPDAVILDLETSVRANSEVAERLRSISILRNIYLISLSNNSKLPFLNDAFRIDVYLKKPMGYNMVVNALSHHFSNPDSR